MSFFEKLFPKPKPKPVPVTTAEEELQFLKSLLSQSFSKTYLLQQMTIQEFELKEESDEEMIFQGRFGFFLAKLNEDHEIYHFLYTALDGQTHLLVRGDHLQYGHLTFKEET